MTGGFMKNIFLIILAAVLTSMFDVNAQDKFKLEYKFEKGKTYRYQDVTKGKIIQEMMGQEDRTDIKSETFVKILADSISPNNEAMLLVCVDSVKVTLITKREDKALDLPEVIGKRIKFSVSKLGKILKKEILDPVKIKGMTQEMDLRELVQMPLAQFPENEIKIGDKWDAAWVDTIEAMGGKAVTQSKYQYKLKGKENKNNRECLKIEFEGKETAEGSGNMQGMEIYFEKENKNEGTMYLEINSGIVVLEESEAEELTTISTAGAHSMMIPITQTTETTRILLDK
jgi:hypothetical protein